VLVFHLKEDPPEAIKVADVPLQIALAPLMTGRGNGETIIAVV
jgi:hypothetical protein